MTDLDERVEQARVTLLNHATRHAHRARRARAGSNERKKCIRTAQALSACVAWIDAEEPLRDRLIGSGACTGGWRALWRAVGEYVREKEAKHV